MQGSAEPYGIIETLLSAGTAHLGAREAKNEVFGQFNVWRNAHTAEKYSVVPEMVSGRPIC